MVESKNVTLRKIVAQKPQPVSSSKGWLPHINFDFKQLPEAKNWEVGNTYKLVLVVKQVSKTEDDFGGNNVGFEIIKVGVGENDNG
jgi:hypothetical protein